MFYLIFSFHWFNILCFASNLKHFKYFMFCIKSKTFHVLFRIQDSSSNGYRWISYFIMYIKSKEIVFYLIFSFHWFNILCFILNPYFHFTDLIFYVLCSVSNLKYFIPYSIFKIHYQMVIDEFHILWSISNMKKSCFITYFHFTDLIFYFLYQILNISYLILYLRFIIECLWINFIFYNLYQIKLFRV